MKRRRSSVRWSRRGSFRPARRRWARAVALLSAAMLVVSGLSLSALTAGIQITQEPALGPPWHRFDEASDLAASRRTPIPRAAFERAQPLPVGGPPAFGGDRIYDIDVDGTSYRVHEFTEVGSSSFRVTRPMAVDYLVVAGGGGGGSGAASDHGGGGGGAGGVLHGTLNLAGSSTIPVVVGNGGAGGDRTLASHPGVNGGNSSLGDVEAIGGGGGGDSSTSAGQNAKVGGSGGGGAALVSGNVVGSGAAGTSGQGNKGGDGNVDSSRKKAGGGGGATAAGADGDGGALSSDGGAGFSSSITGTSRVYGAGGGGGSHTKSGGGGSFTGPGAGGVVENRGAGTPGEAGSGGGGGGGSGGGGSLVDAGGAGGSGIVIVRYEIPRSVWAPEATGGDTVEIEEIDGVLYRVHTFTEGAHFVIPEGSTLSAVDLLLVGGGGGGGARHAGGGGGGGMRELLHHPVDVDSHPVVVGAGGSGEVGGSAATSGGSSSALGIEVPGGGAGGGDSQTVAQAGGSGGGARGTAAGGNGTEESGIVLGHAGGSGVSGSGSVFGTWAGGGGGGAGGPGGDATRGGSTPDARAGDGGSGRATGFFGDERYFAGGGGGSHATSRGDIAPASLGSAGRGGLGGGGAGGSLGWNLFWTPTGRTNHPMNAAEFDTLISGAAFQTAAVASIVEANSSDLSVLDVLNWGSAAQFARPAVTNREPRPSSDPAIDNNHFAFIVTGTFVPLEDGVYTFTIAGDDAVDLFIGEGPTQVVAHYGGHAIENLGVHTGTTVELEAGKPYAFRVRMEERTGGEGLRLFWRKPSQAGSTLWFRDPRELGPNGQNGVENTGGGGGGGGNAGSTNGHGGSGGSGIVAIRYPLTRELASVPSSVGNAIVGESATGAVLRWEAPAFDAPDPGDGGLTLDEYRIEYRPFGDTTWNVITAGVTFTRWTEDGTALIQADVNMSDVPAFATTTHQFRITPRGAVDGPVTVVGTVAKGGDTVTIVDGDVVHHFTTPTLGAPGSFTLTQSRPADVLVVAGGGGGGATDWGGGGGAGGILYAEGLLLGAPHYSVTVGRGGVGATTAASGQSGENSSFGAAIALGGGGGGAYGWTNSAVDGFGVSGGSGGGAGENTVLAEGGSALAQNPPEGWVAFGNGGGNVPGGGAQGGGGGGGAGEAGKSTVGPVSSPARVRRPGAGGDGREFALTGSPTWYGGGGGGGTSNRDGSDNLRAVGGKGGGGAGAFPNDHQAENGAPNTGGGGGGGSGGSGWPGGAGGSGVVIVRYAFSASG